MNNETESTLRTGQVLSTAAMVLLLQTRAHGLKLHATEKQPPALQECIAKDLINVSDLHESGTESLVHYAVTERGHIHIRTVLSLALPQRRKLWVDGNGNVVS